MKRIQTFGLEKSGEQTQTKLWNVAHNNELGGKKREMIGVVQLKCQNGNLGVVCLAGQC